MSMNRFIMQYCQQYWAVRVAVHGHYRSDIIGALSARIVIKYQQRSGTLKINFCACIKLNGAIAHINDYAQVNGKSFIRQYADGIDAIAPSVQPERGCDLSGTEQGVCVQSGGCATEIRLVVRIPAVYCPAGARLACRYGDRCGIQRLPRGELVRVTTFEAHSRGRAAFTWEQNLSAAYPSDER